jgi:tRNA nucleotidyltransferase (CCA-adding enzyme)
MPHRHAAVPVPEHVADMLDAALEAAADLPLYLVGGAVRDLLRGEAGITDIDLAVEGDAAAVATRLRRRLGGARVTVHAAFGTSTVRWEDMRIDIARTRSESYARPGALPTVEPAGIEADLLRRDFTVNAIGLRLGNGDSLLDPAGGRGDLERRAIRVLHGASFSDDPTRVFRAVRYAARLGFELEDETEELARAAVGEGLVGHLSGSRVRAELVALLCEPVAASDAVRRLGALGACRAVWPGLDCDPDSQELLRGVEALRQRYSPRTPAWRAALVVLARHLPDADLPMLAHRLVLRRRDAATVRAAVAIPVPDDAAGPAAVAEAYASRPVEAALLAAASGSAAATTYLDHLRGVRLSIDGSVLREELGLEESPRVGEVLRELLRRKRNGELETRAAELAAAREILAGTGG